MKNTVIKILILFFIFLISFFSIYNSKKSENFIILDVIEADEFYIDFNKNNIIEENELAKLKNIEAFKPIETNETEKISNELGISTEEYLKIGYITQLWAKENLKHKEVYVSNYKNCSAKNVCKVEIKHNNEDLSKFLLTNGMAYIKNKQISKNYFQFLNIKETKNIAKELSKINFTFLNHKPNSIQETNGKNSINNTPKTKNIYKNSIFKSFKNIDLYLINPLESKKPNAKCENIFCKRIIKEINSTSNSIDVALYGFGEQKEILNALIKAKERGVKIRIVLDSKENYQNSYYSLNQSAIENFKTTLDNSPTLMHNKFFIFDNNLVLTGSTNITSTGSGGYNSNLGILIRDEKIANIYKNEFEQMFNSSFSKYKTRKPDNSSSSNIQVYFSPKDDIYEKAIEPHIKNAKKNIYISIFYLTHDGLINELIEAKKRAVNVKIIIDATSANNFSNKIKLLRSNNIPTIVEDWGGKNHEKTVSIDGKILITGSSNFSKSGFYRNDENILVIRDSEIVAFWEKHFLNLFTSINKKYLFSIPRAESFDSKNSCFDGIDNNFDGKIDSEDIGCQNKK